ncbi:hypothetical protein EVG20_g3343 [Dentipellis fragilis]|uniref:Major facilitator superfamily (MFS) profile domain-containing protein n=1 Tax=Dentipellis fragilis TaxID=205917 RepID=A0A4Y9Z4L6_9AGAM|nr:hypothetical protein EVG20_g3343 [Dentipellis fragilis]
MPQFRDRFGTDSPVTQGLVVSSILMTASVAAIFSGPFADRFSRTHIFATGAVIFSLGSLITATSGNLGMLLTGRCIAGFGQGLFWSTITVYITEIAPTNIRGRLSCIAQLYITMGIALGYFVSYGCVKLTSSTSWRLPFIIQTVLSLQFALGSVFLPHSPRWLQHVGRTDEASRTWSYLGFSAIEVQKEQEFVQRQASVQYVGWYATAKMLWSKDVRGRTALGVFLMAMQQACGINAIVYYAPILFAQAGLKPMTTAFLASGISALLNCLYTIVAQTFTDRLGRRSFVIVGGTMISISMLLIGTLYATHASESAVGKWMIVGCLYLFLFVFSMTWGIVTRIYCTEIQPIRTRAAATSLAQCAHWVVDWLIAFTAPLYLSKSASGPYFLFGSCALLTAIVCVLFQPESRGITLEGLDGLFEVSPWRKLLEKYVSRRHEGREEPIALTLRRA